jgi:hypothetical protein
MAGFSCRVRKSLVARECVVDLKLLLERALNSKVKLKQGEKEQIVTKAAAGIEQLVNQFAKGDRHARRDLIALADKLGVDLLAGQGNAIQEALTPNHQAILDDYLARRSDEGAPALPHRPKASEIRNPD